MPKIKITEFDRTGVIQSSQISNTVFVPIKGSKVDDNPDIKLLSSITELNAFVGESMAKAEPLALDYKLCKRLLNVGLKVLATMVPGETVPTTTWESLKDRSLYDIRFITLGSSFTDMASAEDVAKDRGDCVALLNLPLDFSYAVGDGQSGSGGTAPGDGTPAAQEIESYTAEEPATVVEAIQKEFEAVGSSEFAAAFVPNFTTLNSDLAIKTVDETKSIKDATGAYVRKVYNTEEETIPAAFGYLFAYANAIRNNPEWYAIAGFQRGIIPELYDVCYDLSGAEMDALQKRTELDEDDDNVGVAINPIAYVRPAGYIIYGNRTMRDNDASMKTVATSFLNVRNLVSAVQKQLYNAARKYTFEPNNELLWARFKGYVSPLLEQMQAGNGILGYKFIRLETPAKARLRCRLIIVPIEAVEDFEIDIVLSDSLTVTE